MFWTKYSFTHEDIATGIKKKLTDEAQELFIKTIQNANHTFVVNYEDDAGSYILINENDESIGFDTLKRKWADYVIKEGIPLPIGTGRLILLAGDNSKYRRLLGK